MQVCVPSQSVLCTQALLDGAGAVTQRPLVQVWPVPQLAADEQAGWQAPLTHRPPWPHSLLKSHEVDGLTVIGGRHEPLTQLPPDEQSWSVVQALPPAGAQVPFWQVKPLPKAAQSESTLHRPVSLHSPSAQ